MWIIRGLEVFRMRKPLQAFHIRIKLASWHSPHSLTWRWYVDLSFGAAIRPHFNIFEHNCGGYGWASVLGVSLNWHWQKPMWFRDLYMELCDIEDIRSGRMWVSERHPLRHHMPTPPPPKPTVAGPEIIQ